MKKIKSTPLMLIVLGLSFSVTACGGSNNNDQNHSEAEHSHENMEMNHDETAHEEAIEDQSMASTDLVNLYLAIKNALVEDNKDGASKAADDLVESLSDVDMEGLSDSEKTEMKELVEVIKEHGEHIAKSEMDHQREHFAMLSNDMADFVAMAGYNQTLYKQYCPMFDDGKGGSWLSLSKDIENPLFGSKMLKCGKVKETITAM